MAANEESQASDPAAAGINEAGPSTAPTTEAPPSDAEQAQLTAPDAKPNPVKAFLASTGLGGTRPMVTILMLAICVGVYALMVGKGVSPIQPSAQQLIEWGGNYGPRTTAGQWWRLLTAMFVHIGIVHLAFNALVIKQIGSFMERLLGHAGMAMLYLGAGLGGGLATLVVHPDLVSAGASGSGWGLYGGLLGVLIARRHLIPADVVKSLGKTALVFIAYNVAYSFQPNVDFAAHLGGLGTGFLLGLVLPLNLPGSTRESRNRRLARIAMASTLLLAVAALAVPRPSLVIHEVTQVEEQVVGTYKQAARKFHEHQMSANDFSTVLRDNVIAPWYGARVKLAGVRRLTGWQLKYLTYMGLREEAWEALLRAVPNDSASDLALFKEKNARADALFKELLNGK